MGNSVFKLNNVDYNIDVISLKRNFEVADEDSSGRLQNWKMYRNVVGTFYNYTLQIGMKDYDEDSYNAFYQAISSPTASHVLEIAYGKGILTFDAYVTKGSDELTFKGRINIWDNLQVNFIAMEPQRKATT